MTQDIELDRFETENRQENRRYENSTHIECCNFLIYNPKRKSPSSSKMIIVIIVGFVLIIITIVLGIYFGLTYDNEINEITTTTYKETSTAVTQTSTSIFSSTSKIYFSG